MQTWLRKNLASDLLIKPMDVTIDQIRKAGDGLWWEEDAEDELDQDQDNQFVDYKLQKSKQTEIAQAAKKHSMNTDVKKAVFQVLVGAEDCF